MNSCQLNNDNPSATRAFINACSVSCQRFLRRMEMTKETILSEFRNVLGARGQMAELALTEAEALAHETGFPLLVYPTLAREKVEAVAAWNRRQEAMLHRSSLASMAA